MMMIISLSFSRHGMAWRGVFFSVSLNIGGLVGWRSAYKKQSIFLWAILSVKSFKFVGNLAHAASIGRQAVSSGAFGHARSPQLYKFNVTVGQKWLKNTGL